MTRSTLAATTILLAISAFGLSGCASATDNASPASSTSPAQSSTEASAEVGPTPDAKYGSIIDFAAAVEAAGADCDFVQTNAVPDAAESGNCGSNMRLMTFVSESDRDAVIDQIKALDGDTKPDVLVGPNWLLVDADAADFRDELGGTIISFGSPS